MWIRDRNRWCKWRPAQLVGMCYLKIIYKSKVFWELLCELRLIFFKGSKQRKAHCYATEKCLCENTVVRIVGCTLWASWWVTPVSSQAMVSFLCHSKTEAWQNTRGWKKPYLWGKVIQNMKISNTVVLPARKLIFLCDREEWNSNVLFCSESFFSCPLVCA